MVYKAIGLMSGSSLDGLDIVFAEFHEDAGKWNYEILEAACYPYTNEWTDRLQNATTLPALDYQLLHTSYGHYIGHVLNQFIEEHQLQYKVALVSSHGHTSFHLPEQKMTAQLGDGAAIAAATGLPVVTDLRALDVAFGGQGAPIVPIGEKMLWSQYDYFLNLGGIANISCANTLQGKQVAFDVCPANRVLNMLANDAGSEFDKNGEMAASGLIDTNLLEKLNSLGYYGQPYPKSLSNQFGTDIVYPIIRNAGISINDALRTYVEHIIIQIKNSLNDKNKLGKNGSQKLLATGGGVLNIFLIGRLKEELLPLNIELIIPDTRLINYKEALIMALIGVLRWRQEYNVLSSVTGAVRNSIGGALWTGQEA
jgi:anhydro-N-acetylmuramic acid kinase